MYSFNLSCCSSHKAGPLFFALAFLLVLVGCDEHATQPNVQSNPANESSIAQLSDEETQALVRRQNRHVLRQEEFLQANQRLDAAKRLQEEMNLAGLYSNIPSSAKDLRKGHVEYLSQRLAILGFTAERVSSLKEHGIDIYKSAAAGADVTIAERAALSELVVIGQVEEMRFDRTPQDGFRSSLKVQVQDVLKGSVSSDYVVVRQKTGETASGEFVEYSTDLQPEPGETFLLFLSNALYEYEAATEEGGLNRDANSYYVIQRGPYRVQGEEFTPAFTMLDMESLDMEHTRSAIRAVAATMAQE